MTVEMEQGACASCEGDEKTEVRVLKHERGLSRAYEYLIFCEERNKIFSNLEVKTPISTNKIKSRFIQKSDVIKVGIWD